MIKNILKYGVLATVVVFVVLAGWFVYEFNHVESYPAKEVCFVVEKGQTVRDIANDLDSHGLIRRPWVFILGNKVYFSSESLKAGEYLFHPPLSSRDILEMFTSGRIRLHPLTIPEGLTRREIASLIGAGTSGTDEDFLEASVRTDLISDIDPSAADLEGYLYPETYHFPKDTSAKDIVGAMVDQFKTVFNSEWKDRTAELEMSVRDIVILASLIESETSRPEERPLVSSVFHNRLRLGMKLDCDPTIIYVLKNEGRFRDRLRTKDLKLDSPYNTYLYPGLPPGPIINPGRDSLQAALFPAETDFLYFVSKNDGSHHFSTSFREHQNAVNTYQRRK